MAAAINRAAAAAGMPYKIIHCTMPQKMYAWHVGSAWENETDWNATTGKMRVIKVLYPDEWYAMPRYLTTKDLQRLAYESDRTYDGFMNTVLKDIEI